MAVDLHYICKHGLNHKHLGDQVHESGEWTATAETAQEAVGGRIYLHERQKDRAWHGGTIISWRLAPDGERKIFTYKVDGDFRISCPGNWGQERAIIRR
jgi:hypothetical protein